MKASLAIVIVNYKVRYFLKQCLSSVFESISGMDAKVYVVDNDSQDGSVQMIKSEFPSVKLIENQENLGFGKANNQVLEIIESDYLLYLNPDTIVTKVALLEALTFLNEHEDAGAVGVKLIDGSGNYHEESKRGFPSIFTAFSKMSGLNKLFPKSKLFNYYYMGHLNVDQFVEVDVLCGAFMLTRTSLMKTLKGFDEDFFMYGEDIDLCYRIKEEGYKIFYLPESSIIHFKGESSKKLSYRYIKSFYGAMLIYLRKRQESFSQKLLLPLFSIAVLSFAVLKSFFNLTQKWFTAIFDFALLFGSSVGFAYLWGRWYHNDPDYFSHHHVTYLICILSLIYVFGFYIFGKYDQEKSFRSIYRGFIASSIISFLVYAFMPESLRSSRIIVLVGAVIALLYLLIYQTYKYFSNNKDRNRNYIIVGNQHSADKLHELMSTVSEMTYKGFVSPKADDAAIGVIEDLEQASSAYEVDEIIFSSSDLSFSSILDAMVKLGNKTKYKLASEDNVSVLSSHSAKKQGQIYTVDLQLNIDDEVNKRIKRLSDIVFSLVLILLFPLLILFKNYRTKFIGLFSSLVGNRSVFGFKHKNENLSSVKQGVFYIEDIYSIDVANYELDYAKRYSFALDLEYIIQAIRNETRN